MTWGFSFRGTHSNTKNLEVVDVKRRPFPQIYSKTFTVPAMHGVHYFGYRYGMGEIDVEVLLNATSLEDFRNKSRDLASWLQPEGGEGDLIFDDDLNYRWKAVVTNMPDWEQTRKFGTTTIRFILPDPFLYALGSTSASFSSGSASVNNNGGFETFPLLDLTIAADSGELKITHQESGEYVRLVRNFVIGDVVTIDCATGEILLNGNDIRASMDLLSDFFGLGVGSNTLTVDTGSITGDVVFTERWMG